MGLCHREVGHLRVTPTLLAFSAAHTPDGATTSAVFRQFGVTRVDGLDEPSAAPLLAALERWEALGAP